MDKLFTAAAVDHIYQKETDDVPQIGDISSSLNKF